MRCNMIVSILCLSITASISLSLFASDVDEDQHVQKRKDAHSYVLLIIAPDSKPGSKDNVEYRISQERFASLPEWEQCVTDGHEDLPISFTNILGSARRDIVDRYGADPQKTMLSRVELNRVQNTTRSVWYFVVVYRVSLSSRPFHPAPGEMVDMRSVVLMDGSVVTPSVTELSRSVQFLLQDQTETGTFRGRIGVHRDSKP